MRPPDREGRIHADQFHGSGLLALDPVDRDDEGAVDPDEFPFREHFQQGFHRNLGYDVALMVQMEAGVVVSCLDILDGGQRDGHILVVRLDGHGLAGDGLGGQRFHGGLGLITWGTESLPDELTGKAEGHGKGLYTYPASWGYGSTWENNSYWDFTDSNNLHEGIDWMKDIQ